MLIASVFNTASLHQPLDDFTGWQKSICSDSLCRVQRRDTSQCYERGLQALASVNDNSIPIRSIFNETACKGQQYTYVLRSTCHSPTNVFQYLPVTRRLFMVMIRSDTIVDIGEPDRRLHFLVEHTRNS